MINEFVTRYPRLFHMAEYGSWPSIQQHGLLSTSALLDLFEVAEHRRSKIETEWRPEIVSIQHSQYGIAKIRDQAPMPPHTLAPQLDGMTPGEWYELLNGKCFFWLSEDRLQRLLKAAAYRLRTHDVLVIDTRAMIERHMTDITLTSFNSGVSSFGPKIRRGSETFKGFRNFRKMLEVVELAVDYKVADISDITIRVEQRQGSQHQKVIWQRPE